MQAIEIRKAVALGRQLWFMTAGCAWRTRAIIGSLIEIIDILVLVRWPVVDGRIGIIVADIIVGWPIICGRIKIAHGQRWCAAIRLEALSTW